VTYLHVTSKNVVSLNIIFEKNKISEVSASSMLNTVCHYVTEKSFISSDNWVLTEVF